MSQDASAGGGALADAGSGGGRRRYKGRVEIKWGGHTYSAFCDMDPSAAVAIALKDLRDIVCRSHATHRECEQLTSAGTPFGSKATKDEMSLGSKAEKQNASRSSPSTRRRTRIARRTCSS